MVTQIRKTAMLKYIQARDQVTVQELSEMFNVSDMTIRRDLMKLEQEGTIRRTYGGAIAMEFTSETPVQVRSSENLDLKIAIAEAAAKLVQPRDTILMDAGTTVMEVARRLPEGLDLTVITNAYTVVSVLIEKPGINLVVLGGPIQHISQVTVGAGVIDSIKSLNVDKAFITASGFSLERGLTDVNIFQSEIKKHMMAQARIRTLLIDSSKYGTTSLCKFSDIQEFDQVVIDNKLNRLVIEQIRALNTNLIIAET